MIANRSDYRHVAGDLNLRDSDGNYVIAIDGSLATNRHGDVLRGEDICFLAECMAVKSIEIHGGTALAHPFTYHLSDAQFNMLANYNNNWANELWYDVRRLPSSDRWISDRSLNILDLISVARIDAPPFGSVSLVTSNDTPQLDPIKTMIRNNDARQWFQGGLIYSLRYQAESSLTVYGDTRPEDVGELGENYLFDHNEYFGRSADEYGSVIVEHGGYERSAQNTNLIFAHNYSRSNPIVDKVRMYCQVRMNYVRSCHYTNQEPLYISAEKYCYGYMGEYTFDQNGCFTVQLADIKRQLIDDLMQTIDLSPFATDDPTITEWTVGASFVLHSFNNPVCHVVDTYQGV